MCIRDSGYRDPTSEFIDGITYDGRKPNAYIDSLTIGLKGKQKVEDSDVALLNSQ